nr:Ribonucleotide Reductase R2-like protein [uncultured Mediterranean phage uvMED]BAR25539.1 Ribonucleotide Reductase R2-like protein [uncultured Mediterranean phage uvMED]
MNSPYLKIVSRKRSWTPLEVSKGDLVLGSEDALHRALALRILELPVKEFLGEALAKDLPKVEGVREALMSNQRDEDKHDLGLSYVVQAHGVVEKSEREASRILKAWLDAPEHPILKASILERSVFFVLLPFFRFNGDMGIRSLAADISRDEQTHVALHGMVCHDLGLKSTANLNKLRRATVAWVMDGLETPTHENKYLDKDFWMKSSDSLYLRGKAEGLADTQRARMPAFFESSNVNLPKYG